MRKDILSRVAAREGFSLTTSGQVPTEGYMVGLVGKPTAVWNPAKEPVPMPSLEAVYKAANAFEGFFIGGWYDRKSGLYYLDVSENIQDRAQAELLGWLESQLAIWDVVAEREIRLYGDGGVSPEAPLGLGRERLVSPFPKPAKPQDVKSWLAAQTMLNWNIPEYSMAAVLPV